MRENRFALADLFWRRSFKTRVTIFTLAIFLIGIWSLAFYASRMLREDMQRLLGEQQFSTISLIAANVDHELARRLKTLEKVAGIITPAILGNTAALQTFLEQRTNLQEPFNAGVVIFRLDGTVIAEIPRSAGRIGVNYLDVDTISAALKEGKTAIGRPVMGRKLRAPFFPMTTPIRDAQGKVIGALAGVTNLGMPNFLDQITENTYGKTGGYLLLAPQFRQVITASDKTRVMEQLPAPGISPWIDRVVQGHEGTDIFVNPHGVEVLTSVKGVRVGGWITVVALPTAEAFAPIRAMQRRMLLATLFLTLLVGGLSWWMLRRQLSPMLVAARTLAAMADVGQPLRALPIAGQDEIGQFIGGFNRLLETLEQREESLKESETRYRLLADHVADVLWVLNLEQERWIYMSPSVERLRGYSLEEAMAQSIEQLMTAASYANVRPWIIERSRLFLSGAEEPHAYLDEIEQTRKDGSTVWTEISTRFIRNEQGELFVLGVSRDIDKRKRLEQERERYFRFFQLSTDAMAIADPFGCFERVNPAFLRMTDYSESELLAKPFLDFVLAEDRQRTAEEMKLQVAVRPSMNFENRYVCKDGNIIVLSWTAYFDKNTGVTYATARDVTASKQAEMELRIAAAAFESQEGMFVTDAAGVILKVNQAFTKITGYSAAEAAGQPSNLIRSNRHDAAFYAAILESIRHNGSWQGEIWNRRKNGEAFPEWLAITAVKDDNGATSHYVNTLTDITERKAAEKEISYLAFHDPLTRLPNRRLLLDRLQQAMASSARSGREGALLFIDLDNFKDLNDTLGHDIGDLLLQQVAQRLSTCIREGDTVARLGGDEFVVMLEDLSENLREAASQTKTVGEKILATLNRTYQLAGHQHHSTPSIGATLFVNHEKTVDELFKRADLAMYRAKTAGRNTLRFFDPEMQAAVNVRAALEKDLRTGLQAAQFLIYYQAQVDAAGRLIGAESLVRWQHPQRGLVPPTEFIPLAEATGLILPLGLWVLETACAQLVAWAVRPDMAHLTLAVNVSARQFHHPDFVEQVLAVLDQTGANPHKLKLELTESMLVHDVEDVILKMVALKAAGVRFSLDDFGTGYSSLSYLKRLPLDQLKIDQSFVRNVCTDINEGEIARIIIALSQTMGLAVIAEGVETEEQRDFLARLGCQDYQGYLFSRPLPLAEFEQLIKS